MIGITAFGGYVPYNRIKTKSISEAYGKHSKDGEKAVAYYDEDSITMAVAASLISLDSYDKNLINGVFFASTTSPYSEKQAATNIAAAIDLRQKAIRTADFSNSLRASTSALLSGIESARSGNHSLVSIGDCRLGGPDGPNELLLGDGAAAFIIGNNQVLAEYLDSYSVSADFIDNWRSNKDIYVRDWGIRYAVNAGYRPLVHDAVEGLLSKTGLKINEFNKIILYAHQARYQKQIAKELGFTPEQIQESMYDKIGNTGCAAAPLMLIAALEKAQPGDKLLYVSYGEGCDAIVFEVTEQIRSVRPKVDLLNLIEDKNSDVSYSKYLKWKNLMTFEPQKRPEQERSSLPDYFRNYKKNNALYGSKCKICGVPQFPPQRVCANCQSIDEMEEYQFLGRKAWIKTYTFDNLSLSLDPPNILVVVEFEGGGKLMTYLVDCDKDDLKINMEVTMSFQKLFKANGVNTYFWKAVPKRIRR